MRLPCPHPLYLVHPSKYDVTMRLRLFVILIALSLLLIACDPPAENSPPLPSSFPTATPRPTPTPHPTATPIPTPTPAPTATPSPTSTPTVAAATSPAASPDDTPDAIIDAAVTGMRALKTFHADVDAAFKVVQTEASFRMDEQTFGSEFPVRFTADFQAPDRSDGKLLLSLGFVALELSIITIGDDAYITNPETGVWERYPLIYTGLPDPYDLALPPADISRYSDIQVVKDETLDGVQTRHIRANLRDSVLGSAYDNLYVEMWIGIEDNLIRRLTMAGETTVDEQDSAGLAGRSLGAADIGGKAEFSMTVTYSNFNQPVTIEPPIP